MDTVIHSTNGAVYGGRFQCLQALKSGPGTETLLGRDLRSGEPVIIKTAKALEPDSRLRLEHEARVLGDLANADFKPLIEYGRQDTVTYVVMPFVPGVTLRERLDRGRLSLSEVLVVGCALTSALERAHERGVIHRDIKPSNVIVDDGSALSQARLIDFGFARSALLDASVRDMCVGTLHYLPPEQAGLLSRPVDERSDLYAVGIVLFECAAGRVPFPGQRSGEILRAHLCERPPNLRSLGCEIPRALDEMIQRLLRKDPDDRYQTAAALSADLTDLSDALARGVADPVVVGIRDRRQTLTEPAFVGRERELVLLDSHLAHAQQGRGGLVLVEAESGGGKTRLLEEFAQRCAGAGVWVLRGQAVDQAAIRPFHLLDGVVQGVVTRLETDAGFADHLRRALGEQREAVCEAVPPLAGHLGAGSAVSLGQEAHGEIRSLRALTALLDALAADNRPVVMVLDDAQWADDLTLKLLDYRQRRADRGEPLGAQGKGLILVAFRQDEVSPDHRLRRIASSATLALSPFAAADIRRLAESMAGRLPDEAVDLIVQLADGSPFMATAVLQGLVEIGALIPGGEESPSRETLTWRVDPHAMEEVRSSRRAAVLLARRLESLPPATRRLLAVAAVLGKEFSLSLGGDLAGLPEHESAAGCRDAARRHLIWVHDNGARCVFVHDKIREVLLNGLNDDERRALHAAAAAKIEAEDPGRVFELAYHFDNAGQSERAVPYALRAAEEARARYALEIAEQQYRTAERGAPCHNEKLKWRVAEGLGDVLMLLGAYDEAEKHLTAAGRLASDCEGRVRVELKLGELALKRGDVGASRRALEKGLRLLKQIVPRRVPSFLALAVWEACVQSLHTLLPSLFVGRRTLQGAETELLTIRLYSRLAYTYYFIGHIQAIWAHLREMNLAERYPPTRERAQAYSNHIAAMELLSWFGRGTRYAERSLQIRRQFGDLWGEGQTCGFYGFLLLSASKFDEALDKLRHAASVLERAGDHWERHGAWMDAAACLYRQGALNEAVEVSRRTYRLGIEIGAPKTLAGSLDVWAKASGGRIPAEVIAIEFQRTSDDVLRNAQLLQADAVRRLGLDDPRAASEVLDRAWRAVIQANFQSEEVASIPAWLTTALRISAQRVSIHAPQERIEFLKRALRVARQACRLARRYRNNLPHALREAGLLAAMRGKPRKARKCFDESLAVAAQQGAKFEHAQTLWARGQVGSAVGWSAAAADLEQGRTALRALGAYWVLGEDEPAPADRPVTPALIERFDALLQAGRQIASALTRDAVWAAVRDAALALLRGEECLMVSVARGAIHVIASSGEDGAVSGAPRNLSAGTQSYSRCLVERAIGIRRPVTASVGVNDEPSESLVLAGARSVLCAPIAVRGEVVACLYISHRSVGGLFGPDEERLAEFIATLAGAALENVEGMVRAEGHVIANSTAGLAHAIKNPVAVLRAYVGLLRNLSHRDNADTINRYLQTMEGALDRIGELVRRLQSVPLHTSRKSVVPLGRLIDEAVAEVRPLFSEKSGFYIDREIAADAPTRILGDGEQLRLMMVNLLVNAHQAMPRGGRVGITVRSERGPMVGILIADQGAGICPSIRPRLFEPFVTSKANGTGLGLWVCKKIVEDHHQGRIEVCGAPGGGTTVRVTLPVGRETGTPPN